MRAIRFGTIIVVISCATLTAARAETLKQYALRCDAATDVTVPDFECEKGTEVPLTNPHGNYPDMLCDRPNRLNSECDPGSHFQVLQRTADAFVVAHCRKRGAGPGRFRDIAVIQHNSKNGATCFYQALADDLPGSVTAPSKGEDAWRWLSPKDTAGIGCARCHDNGAIIRSPYLAQIKTGANALPGAGKSSFNRNQPYAFVGEDFKLWKTYKVEVEGNQCNDCHRLGVNNVRQGQGTALDYGLRATGAKPEPHKNPVSATSPMWMPPDQITFDQSNADSAKQIADCGLRLNESPLPNTPSCRITLFGSAYSGNEIAAAGEPGHHSGNVIQGTFGNRGNFEIVVPSHESLIHLWLNTADTRFGWHGPNKLRKVPLSPTPLVPLKTAENAAIAPIWPQWASMIQSSQETPGNLEVVAAATTPELSETHLVYYVRDRSGWHGPATILVGGRAITGVTGNPALIQSRFGLKGNFELVVPQGNVINHYWRDNDAPNLAWHGPYKVAPREEPDTAGVAPAVPVEVALLQSNFGKRGNFEVIARIKSSDSSGDYLVHYYRDESGWHGPAKIKAEGVEITGVTGAPSFIQATYGTRGNFEMVVPQGNVINHYWRDNDAPNLAWHGPYAAARFTGTGSGSASAWPTAVSLFQSNFGNPGNLELVARLGGNGPHDGQLIHLYRTPQGWQPISPIVADGVAITGVPRL